jgi:8-amino-7-oxononanoate synthase
MQRDSSPGPLYCPNNLVSLIRYRAETQPTSDAFVYLVDGENDEVHLTYHQLDRRARAIAARLQRAGLVGERALLLYPPGLEFIIAYFGCLYAGVVAVPIYPPRRNRSMLRIQAVADDCEARVALSTDGVLERVEPLIDDTPNLKKVAWISTEKIDESLADEWTEPDIDDQTIAFLQYTSGSTGTPKGVVLNHGNLLHNSSLIAYGFEHTRSNSGVFWLPSYHDMGLIGGILHPLYIGRPNVIMSPMSFLQKPFRWLNAISRFRATTSGGPNFAFERCVEKVTEKQMKTLDLSCWKVAFNGAEPVRAETLHRFSEKFAACGFNPEAFYPCYGMAESTLIATGGLVSELPVIGSYDSTAMTEGKAVSTAPDSEGSRDLVGSGKTFPSQKVIVVDPDTKTQVEDNHIGEIWVQGPSVALGYWKQPERTKKIFQAHLSDTGEGPFLRTGDLGFLEDGELFVTGRTKDLIILHGVNHYPHDIELTAQQSNTRLRRDCGAAFTIEKKGEERLVLIQEIERRKQGNLEESYGAIRRSVSAEHELSVDVIVLVRGGTIPKTSSGKIQRHACAAMYKNGEIEALGKWESGVDPEPPMPEPTVVPVEAAPVQRAIGLGIPVEGSQTGPKPVQPAQPTHLPERPGTERVAELVLEQVRLIAKERAEGLMLDTKITEMGLDSLERMEILACLEERFGGRFPEEIFPELETSRDVVAAVEKYLGSEPRERTGLPTDHEIPAEYYEIDQFPEYVQLKQSLDMAKMMGVENPFFTVHQGITNDRTLIDGREVITFSSYNYVGMSGDPVVIKAAQAAAAKYGTSVSASRLVSGEKDIHQEFERAISEFLGTEDAVVFVGGHATNESVIGHMLGPGDLILHDALAHNSIVQGAILSGARRRPFPHNDFEAVERLLSEYRHEYRRVLIAIEGVYSMDGDYPNLPKFIESKLRHKALLMVDEAHSIGTMGKTGRGIGEFFDVNRSDVDVWMSTLSKTFGSCGGYIAGCKELVEYLKYTAPGFVFSVGISPPATAAALASLQQLLAHPERVAKLAENSALFLKLATARGFNTGMSKSSPVVPIILGNSIHCMKLSKGLLDRGVNVQPILYPAVEENAARLRYFITSDHTTEQIRFTVDTMAEVLDEIDPSYLAKSVSL